MKKRLISYTRHHPFGGEERQRLPLHLFLYDLPSLSVAGICPPRQIMNEVLRSGGGDAGMSPGASWEPFSLSEEEYEALLPKLLQPNESLLKKRTRFGQVAWKRDPALEHLSDLFSWQRAVAEKHGVAAQEASAPTVPTLFLTLGGSNESSHEFAPIPLSEERTYEVAGAVMEHPPGTFVLHERALLVEGEERLFVSASVGLASGHFALTLRHSVYGTLLGASGLVPPAGMLYSADLHVRLPEGGLLFARILGPSRQGAS